MFPALRPHRQTSRISVIFSVRNEVGTKLRKNRNSDGVLLSTYNYQLFTRNHLSNSMRDHRVPNYLDLYLGNVHDFDDAIDFVGWYTNMSNESVGISKSDPYNQYLAYHEGHTGWRRKTYQQKDWLKKAARKVDYRSKEWSVQLQHCEDDLDEDWWMVF